MSSEQSGKSVGKYTALNKIMIFLLVSLFLISCGEEPTADQIAVVQYEGGQISKKDLQEAYQRYQLSLGQATADVDKSDKSGEKNKGKAQRPKKKFVKTTVKKGAKDELNLNDPALLNPLAYRTVKIYDELEPESAAKLKQQILYRLAVSLFINKSGSLPASKEELKKLFLEKKVSIKIPDDL